MAEAVILDNCDTLPGGFVLLSKYQEEGIYHLEHLYETNRRQTVTDLITSGFLDSDDEDGFSDSESESEAELEEFEMNSPAASCDRVKVAYYDASSSGSSDALIRQDTQSTQCCVGEAAPAIIIPGANTCREVALGVVPVVAETSSLRRKNDALLTAEVSEIDSLFKYVGEIAVTSTICAWIFIYNVQV